MAPGEREMKSNLVGKDDYELYLMNVPWTLFGKKRRQYIKRELEKVHPCFSEQFSFDSRRCLRKGKIQTLIAVMEKVKVLEYRKNKRSGLRLEGVRTGPMFAVKSRLLVLFMLMAGLIVLFAVRTGKRMEKKSSAVEETITESYDFTTYAEEVLPADKDIGEILVERFEKIKDSGGIIKSASIGVVNRNAEPILSMSLSLEKMFPEVLLEDAEGDVQNSNVSTVTYVKDIPCFEYSVDARVKMPELVQLTSEEVSDLRKALSGLSLIKEEDFFKASFHCELSEEKFADFFNKIDSMESIELNEVIVSRMQKGFDLTLTFMERKRDETSGIAKVLHDYSTLFAGERKKEADRIILPLRPKQITTEKKNNSAWEQVGKVIQKNGRTIVYYRDEKNQLRGVEE